MCDNIFEKGSDKEQWGVPVGAIRLWLAIITGLYFLKEGTKGVKNVLEVFGLEVTKRRTKDYICDRK